MQVHFNYIQVSWHWDSTNSYLCKRWPHERTWAPILDVWISCRGKKNPCMVIIVFWKSLSFCYGSLPPCRLDSSALTHSQHTKMFLKNVKSKVVSAKNTFVFSSNMMRFEQKQVPSIIFTLWFPRRSWAKHKLHFSQWKYFSLGPILQRQ